MLNYKPIIKLDAGADVPADVYGQRASDLTRMIGFDLPLPLAYAISKETVTNIALGNVPDLSDMLEGFGVKGLVSVRSSPECRNWGGAESLLNVGLNDEVHKSLADQLGHEAATSLYCKFLQDFSVYVARLDPEDFTELREEHTSDSGTNWDLILRDSFDLYEDEMEESFPQDPLEQLVRVVRSMSKAWQGTTARILRQANGAPVDAGLGLIVQRMALGMGKGESGAGVAQFVSAETGKPLISGRYLSQAQGRDALSGDPRATFLKKDERGQSLEEICPNAFEDLVALGEEIRGHLKDEMQLDFTVEDGKVWILDAIPARRNTRAAVNIVVSLADQGIISRNQALVRVSPANLSELLHPQISATADRKRLAKGMAASPGAAVGRLVFSPTLAQQLAAKEEPAILARPETGPEDIRGMRSAKGVITERGGMTSHAAVIARGLGVPCIVGASGVSIDLRKKRMVSDEGEKIKEGDWISIDGTTGEVLAGALPLERSNPDDAFDRFMDWADEVRDIGVRANADTVHETRLAASFKADGIGLCRTEHMFFEEGRLTLMRELIFTESEADRRQSIKLLLPEQRADFAEIFKIMAGRPVCIRLLDPPLHEFLPKTRPEMQPMAEAMGVKMSEIAARVEDLEEVNPMLGMRGVRLGITVPEIYDMQARAIFEAAAEVTKSSGQAVKPEIMIPLVSANREVEIVKSRIQSVASEVQAETEIAVSYKLGVMVETPRAALRAEDLAASSSFLSFGTNDLTQMTYGLSRDDAGRFMNDYVKLGVFQEDPFHSLDEEGVGELLEIAAERGRRCQPDLVLGLCGEHGGDPRSLAFCRKANFNYVSCSSFRTPIARLAAAQAKLAEIGQSDG